MHISLKRAVRNLLTKNPNTVFLVEGGGLFHYFIKYFEEEADQFFYFVDRMTLGTAAPKIMSEEFNALRAQALSDPFEITPYTVEQYELECVMAARLSENMSNQNFVLIQFEGLFSYIWQLNVLAYLEQEGLTKHVNRLIIHHNDRDFIASSAYEIDVEGAHAAYCKLICQHEAVSLYEFEIPYSAVLCYLDLNGNNCTLREYVHRISSAYENPYVAYGLFLSDFQHWGIDSGEFLKIAYSLLMEDPKFESLAEKWKRRICKLRYEGNSIAE